MRGVFANSKLRRPTAPRRVLVLPAWRMCQTNEAPSHCLRLMSSDVSNGVFRASVFPFSIQSVSKAMIGQATIPLWPAPLCEIC